MQEFRSSRSYRQPEQRQSQMAEEYYLEIDTEADFSSGPLPLILNPGQRRALNTEKQAAISDRYPVITTEQLTNRTGKLPIPPQSTAPSLISALQSTMSSNTTGRMVVIPGSRKQAQTQKLAAQTPKRRMSARLRHSLTLITIFLVLVTTLISLAPLDNGQSTYHMLDGVGNWFQSLPTGWQGPAHALPVDTTQGNPPASTGLPPVTLPKSQYVAIAQQDAINAGINPDYFVRQINQESGFNPNAVSPAGAVGIAQFLPSTAAGLGIDPWNPIQALRGAAQLMASYSKNYGGDYAKALAAYNAGSGTVQSAVNACGANWLNCIPYETRNYIRVIMGI